MKALFLSLSTFAIVFQAQSQGWKSIGDFNHFPSIAWHDSITDRLYMAGNFGFFNSNEVHGFGYVEGDTLIPLGCGFGLDCGDTLEFPYSSTPEVRGFANFQGELYAIGWFTKAGGTPAKGLAKWVGSDWVGFPNALKDYQGGTSIGYGIEVLNGELYVYGVFDSVENVSAHGIAKFDGQTWSSVFNFPQYGSPNFVSDAEWYQGELYVGGNFSDLGAIPPKTDIVKWNGTSWVAVESGFYGNFGGISTILTHQGKLIIAGAFNHIQNPGSIPGNSITSWDGTNWDTLGGGLFYYSGGLVHEVISNGNDLYAIGGFILAGGIPVSNIAKWDGLKWCGSSDSFEGPLRSGAIKDDSLYVVGNHFSINGDSSLKWCVKWVGPYGDTCQIVSTDPKIVSIDISIFPNPITDRLYIRSEAGIIYEANIYDIHGRKTGTGIGTGTGTGTGNAKEVEINFENIPPGMYVVEVRTGDGIARRKVVRE